MRDSWRTPRKLGYTGRTRHIYAAGYLKPLAEPLGEYTPTQVEAMRAGQSRARLDALIEARRALTHLPDSAPAKAAPPPRPRHPGDP